MGANEFTPPEVVQESDTAGVAAIKRAINHAAREADYSRRDGDAHRGAANLAYRQQAEADTQVAALYRDLGSLSEHPAPLPPINPMDL